MKKRHAVRTAGEGGRREIPSATQEDLDVVIEGFALIPLNTDKAGLDATHGYVKPVLLVF